jgi:hypothetical protein
MKIQGLFALLGWVWVAGCTSESSDPAVDSNSNWTRCAVQTDCADGYTCLELECLPDEAVADDGPLDDSDDSSTSGDRDASPGDGTSETSATTPASSSADTSTQPPAPNPDASAAPSGSDLLPDPPSTAPSTSVDAASPSMSTAAPLTSEPRDAAAPTVSMDAGPNAPPSDAAVASPEPGPSAQMAIHTNAINCCDLYRFIQRNEEDDYCLYLDIRAQVGSEPVVTELRALHSASDCASRYDEAIAIEHDYSGAVEIEFADGGVLMDMRLSFDSGDTPEWLQGIPTLFTVGLPIDGQWHP